MWTPQDVCVCVNTCVHASTCGYFYLCVCAESDCIKAIRMQYACLCMIVCICHQ